MKVLFVRSGNNGLDPISQNQGESLMREGMEVYYFDIIGKGFKGYIASYHRLQKKIQEVRPDVIHAHYSFSAYLASIASKKIPVVTSLMGSDVNTSSWLFRYLNIFFVRYIWKATIVKSSDMKKKLPQVKSVYLLPNGVDFGRFFPEEKVEVQQKLELNSNRINILFGADPEVEIKNYPLAQDALKMLDIEFDIHFLKGIDRNAISDYYNAADVLLLTSFSEGSPNVIKEAMACNCPIVATDVGDIREVIGKTEGCFVTHFEAKEIADRLNEAINYGKRTKGRENIKYLDSSLIAKKLIEIYKTI